MEASPYNTSKLFFVGFKTTTENIILVKYDKYDRTLLHRNVHQEAPQDVQVQ